MDQENPSNITDVLTSSGFPHIEINDGNKILAYECCLMHEVVTKRIPSLHHLREGLMSESCLGTNLLTLVSMHREVRDLLFPPPSNQVNLTQMKQIIQYDPSYMHNPDAAAARDLMNRYLEDLSQRGMP